jgi:hypothetical protein
MTSPIRVRFEVASLPGLTRLCGRSRFGVAKAWQSIFLSKMMDARIKSAHDDVDSI